MTVIATAMFNDWDEEDFADQLKLEATDDLHKQLAASVGLVASNLKRCAWIVGELESRGEDLDRYATCLIHFLRRIRGGQLLPQVVVRLGINKATLITKVAGLPIQDQLKISEGGTFPAVELAPDGSLTHRQVMLEECSDGQIKQILTPDHIRTITEQTIWLNQRAKRAGMPIPSSVGILELDKKLLGATVRVKGFVSLEDLKKAVKFLEG